MRAIRGFTIVFSLIGSAFDLLTFGGVRLLGEGAPTCSELVQLATVLRARRSRPLASRSTV